MPEDAPSGCDHHGGHAEPSPLIVGDETPARAASACALHVGNSGAFVILKNFAEINFGALIDARIASESMYRRSVSVVSAGRASVVSAGLW